jgi:hypothetical protein
MKSNFRGELRSAQPRIRLLRSYDQRQHNYMGYALSLRGTLDDVQRSFSLGIGPGAQAKLQLRVGDVLEGEAEPVADPRLESVELYRASKLRVLARAGESAASGPPWRGVPPALDTYRGRGHRRLDEGAYRDTACAECIWGCRMPVEITLDPWRPDEREYRFETFCYGPKSCPAYVGGPLRTVPGRNNTVWTEEDDVDQQGIAHRGPDE